MRQNVLLVKEEEKEREKEISMERVGGKAIEQAAHIRSGKCQQSIYSFALCRNDER